MAGRDTGALYDRNLIFDIGAHDGSDSSYYLEKGFRVVAAEPNPEWARYLENRFRSKIADGSYALENAGVLAAPGMRTFYLNLATDLWSSFVAERGRRGGRFVTLEAPCLTLALLIERYGRPYYVKLNTEGSDLTVLSQLEPIVARPPFVSVGDFDVAAAEALFALGYNMFSIRPQRDKAWATQPFPPREGRFVPHRFTDRDLGPFGLEVPDWMSFKRAQREIADATVCEGSFARFRGAGEWFDLHATYWPRSLDPDAPRLALAR